MNEGCYSIKHQKGFGIADFCFSFAREITGFLKSDYLLRKLLQPTKTNSEIESSRQVALFSFL